MKVKMLAAWLVCIVMVALIIPAAVNAEIAEVPLGLETTQGAVGSNVKIPAFCQYGTGDYTLSWGDNNQVIMQGTIKSGTCQPITFKVPQSARGKHMVTLQVGSKTFQKQFTVLASISLGKDKGASGTTVDIQGNGFEPGEDSIRILFDGIAVAAGITANSNGGWLYTLELPDCGKGVHQISASGNRTSSQEVGNHTFSVSPSIAITPTTGWVGRVVNISGIGFSSAEKNIEVIYDSTVVKSGITADLNGGWQSSFSIPASSRGIHRLDAQSTQTKPDDVSDITFTVSPGIKVEQSTGRLGETISIGNKLLVSGIGFQGNEAGIDVMIDGTQAADSIVADAVGSWATQIQVPALTKGEHIVSSSGDATRADDVSGYIIIITPQISINPTYGSVGQNTLLNGSGFGAEKPVSIYFDGKQVIEKVNTDLRGNFNTSFKLPASGSGDHVILATDPTHASAGAIFSMEATPPATPALIEPEKGAAFALLDSKPILIRWQPVEDPSGVTYTLEISKKADFSGGLLRKEGLTDPEYQVSVAEKQGNGDYYWRVRATDGAGNASAWSQPLSYSITGFDFLLPALLIGLAVLIIIGLVVWRIRSISKRRGWTSES